MNEIVSGVMHWKTVHPNLGIEVSSYYLVDERVLLDPLEPKEGLDWFRQNGPPEHVLLSNRHHLRHSARFVESFGCTVRASRPGMHEFSDGGPVEPFDYGDDLPGGLKALEVGVICPDETAFHAPAFEALAVADGVINYDGLGFVPDQYIGDDPEGVKRGLREVYARLADQLEFDNLLLAHGDPIVGGARDALREFAAG